MPTIKKRSKTAQKQQPEDEIRSLARQASHFAAANKNVLSSSAAVLVVVLILVFGYRYLNSQREQQAAPLVATAYGYYNPAQGTPPDYGRALEMFRDVQKRFPSTMNGAIAQYYIGNSLMDYGRYDEALKAYQTFVEKYANDSFLLGLVYERIGYADTGLGRQGDAIKAFLQAEKLLGPGAATLEIARLYEAAGNTAGAQQKYKEIADKLAGTPWAMEAMGKVQKISPMPAAAPKTGK